jgi:hypothetical protein
MFFIKMNKSNDQIYLKNLRWQQLKYEGNINFSTLRLCNNQVLHLLKILTIVLTGNFNQLGECPRVVAGVQNNNVDIG